MYTLTYTEEKGQPEVGQGVAEPPPLQPEAGPEDRVGEEGGAEADHAHQAARVEGRGCGGHQASGDQVPPAPRGKNRGVKMEHCDMKL